MNRRKFLAASAGTSASIGLGLAPGNTSETDLVESITQETIWRNRNGQGTTWFHPRSCLVPDGKGSQFYLMTLQEIGGSDYFGPVHWSRSTDLGAHWSDPEPVPSLGRIPVPGHDGLQAGVCDVVPEYHSPTDTTLALGHVVFYRGKRFSKTDQLPRFPLYAVRRADGTWSERRKLVWDDPRGGFIYSNNCGQRHVLPSGDILLAFTFGPGSEAREVAGVRCSFDGENLVVKEVGPALSNPVGRGLLEPSIASFGGRIYLTIRAEDDRGYVSVSEDGLAYEKPRPWRWENGDLLTMSTTQQHWMVHSDGLYLVYTREDASNSRVIRWRSPLWMARVDPDRLCLLRDTEQTVIPLTGDGVDAPDGVPLMGNFHVTSASPGESWVTVGEWLPRGGARGDTRLARIRWARPNRNLAP